MAKTYRPYEPDQILLLPPSLRDWLEPNHLAHFISDLIDGLDLTWITSKYDKEERGYPPYHPVMMTKVLVYSYCIGVASSRRLARATREDVACRMLAANNAPDFRTLASFRREHLAALSDLFVQVLQLCEKAGMVKLAHVAVDGTKIKANASKQRSLTYAQMKEKEQELRKKIGKYFEDADAVDAEEDKLYGADRRGDELPAELADPVRRLEKIRQLKAELEAEAKKAAEEKQKKIDTKQVGHKHIKPFSAEPPAGKQRNLTDAESRLMHTAAGFIQGYNCQAAVDEENQVIVAVGVEQNSKDAPYAAPMIKRIVKSLGRVPETATMDSGYFSREAVEEIEAIGCVPMISAEGRRGAPAGSLTEKMLKRLASPTAKALYARRKCVVEPVFGQIKEARGFRRFLLRGVRKVRAEWALICTGHNILKLWRGLAAVRAA